VQNITTISRQNITPISRENITPMSRQNISPFPEKLLRPFLEITFIVYAQSQQLEKPLSAATKLKQDCQNRLRLHMQGDES
jgi:hypothetical protein